MVMLGLIFRINQCSFIFTNGYYITNNTFGSVNGNLADSQFVDANRGWCNSVDIMKIKIDTNKMKAIIWNPTPSKDINIE